MNLRAIAWTVTPWLMMTVTHASAYGSTDEISTLLRLMPADVPMAAVVVDFEKLDKSVAMIVKRLDPGSTEPGQLAGLKSELGIGEWIDFSKPFGVAAPSLGGNWEGILWAKVPDFATKVKTLQGATEEEGVWQLTFEEADTLFCALKGDYLVAASSKEALAQATKAGESLADEMKSRIGLLQGRDLLIHINIDPVRPMLLEEVAQAAQMAPIIAMMAGQQEGADPAPMTGMLTGLCDAVKAFVEQVAYVDLFVGVSEKAVDATIATGYKDGPIKTYLAKQKPATVPLLTEIEEQPYFLAAGYHVPGKESPFSDYLVTKTLGAMQAVPTGQEGKAGGRADEVKQVERIIRELYGNIEGINTVMALSPHGMTMSGDYIAPDPSRLLELTKQSMIAANPLMEHFKMGARYEALGSRKIGEVAVEEFALKVDPANPSAAMVTRMYGENPRFAMGIAAGRVRFYMGGDQQTQHFFSGKVEKPFAAGRHAAEAIAALPGRRNVLVLIDPAGMLPMLGPALGMPKTDAMPPGPPVAISASLSGEPARVDIHVPLRAIERLIQAMSPPKGPT